MEAARHFCNSSPKTLVQLRQKNRENRITRWPRGFKAKDSLQN